MQLRQQGTFETADKEIKSIVQFENKAKSKVKNFAIVLEQRSIQYIVVVYEFLITVLLYHRFNV